MPLSDPAVVVSGALLAAGFPSAALEAFAEQASAPLRLGFSASADAEFTQLWLNHRSTHVSDSLAEALGSSAPEWVPRGPGLMEVGQVDGLPGLSAVGLWESTQPASEVREALGANHFSDGAVMAHKRLLGRLNIENTHRQGVAIARAGGECHAVFEVDHIAAQADMAQVAQQIALAARLFELSSRQMEWFVRTLPALAPRPSNVVSTRMVLTPRGMLPKLRVTVTDVPVRLALQLYRQFSLLEEGAAARLGALSAAVRRDDEVVDRLYIELRNEEPPGFGITLAVGSTST